MMQFRKGRKSPWQVQVRDISGEKITASFSKKTEAIEFENNLKKKRRLQKHGLELPIEDILFVDACRKYVKKKFSENAASSAKQDESRLRNYWIPEFGNLPVVMITTAMIKERLDYIQQELKHTPADRNRHRALLHTMFHDLFMDNKVQANPVAKIPLLEENKKRVKFGEIKSDQDWEKYLESLLSLNKKYWMMAQIMRWTGVRVMGAAALQYRDVDFKEGIVRLRRIIERASNSSVERTKGEGEGGENVIPLLPSLKHAINSYRESSEFIRPTDFIACNEDGSFIQYKAFRTAHNKAIGLSGIEPFTFHAVRKFFATSAKRAGLTRAEIRELLGHSSEAVTARYDIKDVDHLSSKVKKLGFGKKNSKQVRPRSAKSSAVSGPKKGAM